MWITTLSYPHQQCWIKWTASAFHRNISSQWSIVLEIHLVFLILECIISWLFRTFMLKHLKLGLTRVLNAVIATVLQIRLLVLLLLWHTRKNLTWTDVEDTDKRACTHTVLVSRSVINVCLWFQFQHTHTQTHTVCVVCCPSHHIALISTGDMLRPVLRSVIN